MNASTSAMLLPLGALIVGFVVLAWSADRFVFGAAATARNLGVSPLIVGLTIVGFGTSAPELLISTFAAIQGTPGLAIGNAVGSNIANVGLVLGIGALLAPLIVRSRILKREFPVMFATLVLAYVLCLDGQLSRVDGIALLIGLAILILWTVRLGMQQRSRQQTAKWRPDVGKDAITREFESELEQAPVALKAAVLWLIAGLTLLLVSSKMLVWGATEIALYYGISDLIIGLTIVAIGTSLPEIATVVVSSMKDEDDIALGNVIGSNMFNILGVVGIAGMVHPAAIEIDLLTRDFPVMLGISLVMLIMALRLGDSPRISRPRGAMLIFAYFAYLGWLSLQMGLAA
jgi:cation:H+ antiporter